MDYRLRQAYEQINAQSSEMLTSNYINIATLYENMLLERALLSNKTMFANSLEKAEPENIVAKPTAKDIRIQPINNFTAQDLQNLFKKLNVTLVSALKPGEPGSTSSQLVTYIVKDSSNNQYSVVLGKGKGFGVRDENKAIDELNQQISTLVTQGNNQFILLDINGQLEKINGVRSTPGTPKSDFEFTFEGQPKIFVSHKAGTTAFDYQQYGGTTCVSGKNICTDSEVQAFVQTIKKRFPLEMPPKKSVFRKIQSEELKKIALFGMNYGKEFGINNVNVLVQGSVQLIPATKPNTFVLKAAHIIYNGDLPTDLYEPILYGRFSASRGGNHGVKNLRTAILPLAKISKNTEQI